MHLCISIRWLDDRYHGQIEEGVPEWPPSPLRLFQSLVAATGRCGAIEPQCVHALRWLELLCDGLPPTIITPDAISGRPFLRYVPNNDSDNEKKRARKDRLSEKVVVATYLLSGRTVHYAWKLPDAERAQWRVHRATIICLSQQVVSLGWGVDMATGRTRVLSAIRMARIPGQVWLPAQLEAKAGLRIPVDGTLCELQTRHALYSEQIRPQGRDEPPPINQFRTVEYRRASDPAPRPAACFELQRPEGGYRAFDPPRNTVRVAAMLRHAASGVASESGWPDRAGFVLGHGEAPGTKHQSLDNRRFAYLPLPSIQPRGPGRDLAVGSIRRVCVTVLESGHGAEVDWAKRALAGAPMIREDSGGEIAALLYPAAADDSVLRRYLGSASDWATVSPVVLPGFDDPAGYRRRLREPGIGTDKQQRLLDALHKRIDRLLRKAIRDAGFPDELARHADLDWRAPGFWPGLELAGGYTMPGHLTRYPRLHVRLRWRDASGQPVRVAGPLCLGGGRFSGIGLFAALDRPGKGLDQPDNPTASGG